MPEHKNLRVVIFREEDVFVAQCLEHDICVQGETVEKLQQRFEATLCLEGESLHSISPAPERFHAMWHKAKAIVSEAANTEMRLAA